MFSVITSAMAATPASVTGAYVGASGFSYPSWRGEFYAENARPGEFLERLMPVTHAAFIANSRVAP